MAHKKVDKKEKVKKPKQTFKEYYDQNPEFRERHIQKLKAKVTCECGFVTSKGNLKRHMQSGNHLKRMHDKPKNPDDLKVKLAEAKMRLAEIEQLLK